MTWHALFPDISNLPYFYFQFFFAVSSFTKGEQMVPVLNECGTHCAVFGNHDFGKLASSLFTRFCCVWCFLSMYFYILFLLAPVISKALVICNPFKNFMHFEIWGHGIRLSTLER
jgi:hypothetical protein